MIISYIPLKKYTTRTYDIFLYVGIYFTYFMHVTYIEWDQFDEDYEKLSSSCIESIRI